MAKKMAMKPASLKKLPMPKKKLQKTLKKLGRSLS